MSAAKGGAPRGNKNASRTKRKPSPTSRGRTTSRKRRGYTDAERVAALLALEANGWKVNETARALGIPQPTLSQWMNGDSCYQVLALRDRHRGDMVTQLKNAAWLLAGSVTDQRAIAKAGLGERARAFALVFDRLRVLEGKTPVGGNINLNVNLDLSGLSDKQLELYEFHITQLEQLVGTPGEAPATPVGAGPPEVLGIPEGDVPGDRAGPG